MTEYQLEIKQHVEYPRCRIYKKFVEMLMCDPDIKTSGGSGLYHYTVRSSFANFETKNRKIFRHQLYGVSGRAALHDR